jgi:hypothetical protein
MIQDSERADESALNVLMGQRFSGSSRGFAVTDGIYSVP